VNIDMYPSCNILLTCTGFTSSLTDDNAMLPATLSDGNSTSASSDSHASWQTSSGTIVFNLTQASSAFVAGRLHDTTLYHLSFDLKNFDAQQTASAISCSTGTANVSIPQTPLSVCGQKVPDKVEGLADKVCSQLNSALCTTQDGCPLEVYEPTFLTHSIGQSTPEPGAGNKLCVTLAVNTADFIAGSELVLEGFGNGFANTGMTIGAANTGMTIGAPYLLGFGGSGHGSDGINCDMTSSNETRYIMFSRRNVRERWSDSTVKYTADHLVCLKRNTTNPAQWQYYGVNAWQNLTQEAGDLVVTTITKENSLSAWVFTNLDESTVSDVQSMLQGSDVCVSTSRGRCTDLVVSLFDENAKDALHCPNHHALKVTGDFVMPRGVILEGEHADHFDSTATSGFNSKLTLTVKSGHQLILGDDYHVCFYVENPMHAAASYAISVSTTNSCANIAQTAMVQTTNPLFVSAKKFVASAHQSSPFPCFFSNTIVLRIRANFHVFSGSVITLGGLGSIYPGLTIPIADASGGYDHSQLFRRADDSTCGDDSNDHDLCPSTGVWTGTNMSRFLKLMVSSDKNLVAGETYAIAFDVENPHVIGSSLSLSMDYESPLPLQITLTEEHRSNTNPNVDDVVVNADEVLGSLGLCGNNQTDTAPLFIYEPAFTVANIGQSSAEPCFEKNMISVTLKSNMPLCADTCGSKLTLTGMEGAILPDGPVQLHAILTSGSHNHDHMTFSAAEKGPGGEGLWSNEDKTLTLFLTCCLECNFDYQFQFQVQNPKSCTYEYLTRMTVSHL